MSTFKINKGVVDNLESSLSGKSSTDLDNLSQTGEAHFANSALSNSPYTTNRILEIPQDIKLELVDGTLTLKAGSKLYYPNGLDSNNNPKFTIRVTTEDYVANGQYGFDATPHILCLNNANYWVTPDTAIVFAGATAPTAGYQYMLWYDTANNIVKWTSDSGSTWITEDCSLPFGMATYNGGSYANGFKQIDQIFNGFGYIGSTVFALPGWKFQGTFGVNADGTYKTKIFTLNSVHTATIGNYTFNFYETGLDIREDGSIAYFGCYTNSLKTSDTQPSGTNFMWWNPLTGETHHVDNSGVVGSACVISPRIGLASAVSGKFTSIIQKPIDSVANSNASNFSSAGRSYLSGLGMPSKRYIDLTLGANGSTYTAPANGYVSLRKSAPKSSTVYQYIGLNANSLVSVDRNAMNQNAVDLYVWIPVRKGVVFTVNYSATGETKQFRFYYAEGENS